MKLPQLSVVSFHDGSKLAVWVNFISVDRPRLVVETQDQFSPFRTLKMLSGLGRVDLTGDAVWFIAADERTRLPERTSGELTLARFVHEPDEFGEEE